jgi:hypothetical protein
LKQITKKEFDFARYLDTTSEMKDPINELIQRDFFVKEIIIGDSYCLNINNASATSKTFFIY